jgi:hypothetical protein
LEAKKPAETGQDSDLLWVRFTAGVDGNGGRHEITQPPAIDDLFSMTPPLPSRLRARFSPFLL